MRGLWVQTEGNGMRRIIVLVCVLATLAACSGDAEEATTADPGTVSAQVASYELVAGQPDRFLVGLFTDEGVVSCGSVDLSFAYLGDGSGDPEPGPETTASFLLVPQEGAGHSHDGSSPAADGMEDMDGMDHGEAPVLPTDEELAAAAARPPEVTAPDQVRGVYQASDVTFDRAGVWEATVTVELDGAPQSATAAFQVVEEAAYPAVGQDAPRSRNHVMNGDGAKPAMVDSRASDGWESIPDPELHQTTVADAIQAGRPVVVVVSTPLYCQSRFCGPITDEVQALAADYADRADFIHLEVWRDYQGKVVNEAAAEWVYRGDITEPWVFLVAADGTVADRWANVVDVRELRAALEALPS